MRHPPRTEPTIGDWHTSEIDFQNTIVEHAERHGWLYFHDYDARKNRAGFPDLHFVKHGRQLVFECKRQDPKKAKATKKQTAWIDAYQSAGVVAYVVRPSDLDFIIRLLEEDKETWELAKAA